MFLEVMDVYKDYQISSKVVVNALRGVSFSIELGELVAIIGPSGCGKTTLLNLIGGIDSPSTGKILVNGTDIAALSDRERAKYRNGSVGYIFQDFALIENLTVRENVEIPLLISGEAKNINDKIESCLAEVQMEEYIDRKVNSLSGGQKQRIAIARALTMEPEIILADEPTGSLDSVASKHILYLMQSLRNKKRTVVLVTHNQEIAKLCDRTIALKDGVVCENAVA